jgi:hypothetical protein
MIRAVCFDLYETLVTEAGILKPHKDVWAERLGLPAAPFWAAWNGALHAYATTFAGLALLDRAVTAVKIALLPLTDAAPIGDIASAALTHSVIDAPIREALTLAAPVYYRHW